VANTGPAPKPKHLKLLEGTHRPDREATNAPQPLPEAPNCPTWLGREARAEWRRLVPELAKLNLLAKIDRALLTAWCETWETYKESYQFIRKHGSSFNSAKGYVGQRPEVAIRAKARTDLRLLAAEFGASPSSRTKVSALVDNERLNNPWAKF